MIKKIFLGILILGLAIVTIPPVRDRVQPHLDRMSSFMGQKLEGPLSPILNPYRRLRSQSEMGEIVPYLIRDRNAGNYRPSPDEFRSYFQRNVEGEDGLDYWGTPYILVPDPDSLAIVSAGPDLEYQTPDDEVIKIRYAAPAQHRR